MGLNRSLSIVTLALTGSLVLSNPASAQTDLQWDNGLPAWGGLINMSNYVIAGDVNLGPDVRLDRVRFWTLEFGPTTTFYWALYADGGGIPGTLIASDVVAPSLRENLGAWETNNAYTKYLNELEFGGLNVGAGKFWIALHNGPLTSRGGEFHLVNTGLNGSDRTRGDFYADGFEGDFTEYSANEEFAFQVYGETVPEPITMILLGTGLLGVGGVAARRRRETGELD